jgi:hypothetical protein
MRRRRWCFALLPLLAACTPSVEDAAEGAETCGDPVSTCVLGNGMSLQTRETPKVLAPIHVTLRDVPVQVNAVRIEAGMSGMSMSPVSIGLRNTAPSEWTGELILPYCSQGRSDWLWTLVTQVGSGERRTHIAIRVPGS